MARVSIQSPPPCIKKEGERVVLADRLRFTTPYLDDVIDFHVQILRSYPLSSFDKRRRACSKVRSILTHDVIFSPLPSTLSEKKIRTRAFRTRERKISRQAEYIEAIPFICLYYTYNIWVSKSVDPGNFSPLAGGGYTSYFLLY